VQTPVTSCHLKNTPTRRCRWETRPRPGAQNIERVDCLVQAVAGTRDLQSGSGELGDGWLVKNRQQA
jgi:X-X-X-Leu-X-X-Gly heptad repeat protein